MTRNAVWTPERVETVRKGLSVGMTYGQIAVFTGMPKGAVAGMADQLRSNDTPMRMSKARLPPREPAVVAKAAAFWEGMAPGCRSYSDFHHAMKGAK